MAAARVITFGELSGEFAKLNGQLSRLAFVEPLKNIKVLLVSETKRNFQQSRSPDGEAWKPLVLSRARGGGGKPLYDRSLLVASVTAQGQGHVEQITNTRLVYGTNLDYAASHQFGAIVKPKRGRALSIPLTPEAYRAGSPRNMPDLFMLWPRGQTSGGLFARHGTGKRARLIKHFLLIPKAVIPARPFLGFNERILKTSDAIIAEYVRKRLAG